MEGDFRQRSKASAASADTSESDPASSYLLVVVLGPLRHPLHLFPGRHCGQTRGEVVLGAITRVRDDRFELLLEGRDKQRIRGPRLADDYTDKLRTDAFSDSGGVDYRTRAYRRIIGNEGR
jgi:hypothetical protein